MNLFSILARQAPNRVFFSMLFGALSGIAYALLIPLVMNSVQEVDGGFAMVAPPRTTWFGLEISNPAMATVFAMAIGFIWLSRTWSEVTLARVAVSMASQLRVQLYYRIAHAPLAAVERIGLPRFATAISSDLPRVVAGAQLAPSILMDGVTLLGMLFYLFYLSTDVLWLVLQCIVFGVITHELIFVFSARYFIRADRVNDALQKALHGLVQGFKELKLSNEKRTAYFDEVLVATECELVKVQKTGHSIHSGAANYGQMLSFLVIGTVVFIFVSYHPVSARNLVGIVMTLLYITSPISALTRVVPELKNARIALARVAALLADLPEERVAHAAARPPAWRRVRFEQVAYQHAGTADGAGFKLDLIDCEFTKGEITFIVGGNGSGKSTLSKLLTLHYQPSAGTLYFDDIRITPANINLYRQDISAIYADYHLFDRILVANQAQERVQHYLNLLGLAGKVAYQDGRFSTLALSDGQRRRMALVAAFVEDKELYLFDEWAADQDPTFKEVFYREILPSLRAQGKAVVAITHDDRYFDAADKLLVMEEGRLSTRKAPVRLARASG